MFKQNNFHKYQVDGILHNNYINIILITFRRLVLNEKRYKKYIVIS